jgi:hypothetical protein
MREDDLRPSGNIEDRRGMRGSTKGGLGIGAIIVLSLIGWATGIDPRMLIGGAEMVAGSGGAPSRTAPVQGAPTDKTGAFVARVLGETEDVWSQVLPQQAGRQYEKPVLVLFSGVTRSACGTAPWGRSIALSTTGCTSTRRSSRTWSGGWAAAAGSPTPT